MQLGSHAWADSGCEVTWEAWVTYPLNSSRNRERYG